MQQQQQHTTSFNHLHLNEDGFNNSKLFSETKTEHILSAHLKEEEAHENDIFEECQSEFDSISMPDMESSSSSSSSSSVSSPISSEPKTPDKCSEHHLAGFELRCPPGGSDKVILYTTSLRGIRKTYEDCHTIKFLLESLRVKYFERDVSMHLGFRDELWGILGGDRIIPPRLFIRGRHIGGVDKVITLNENGMLKMLLQGIQVVDSASLNCSLCTGVRFVLCADCNGSCKVYVDDEGNGGGCFVKCTNCNENGLVKCSTCSQ